MAIRKDLDDMLNNLKGGASSARKVQEQKPAKAAPARKSVYDEMSVDDLLSALTVEKKSEPSVADVQEKQPVRSERPTDVPPELERKLAEVLKPEKTAEKASEPVSEKPAEEIAPAVSETVPEENAVPKKRKKKIVITGELPDYEAIRREEIEKNRIEQEKAEAAAKNAAREANELTPVEAIAAAAEKQAEIEASQENDGTAVEAVVKEEIPTKEKNGGGFFFGRKNKHIETEAAPETETEQESVPDTLPEAEKTVFFEETTIIEGSEAQEEFSFDDEAAVITEDAETSVADAFSEALSEAAAEEIYEDELQSDEENQLSVEELLDAAIAGIENAQAAEAALLEAAGEEPASDEDAAELSEESQIQTEESDNETADVEDVPADNNVYHESSVEDETTEEAVETEEKPKKLVLRRILDENPDSIINERSEQTEADDESDDIKSKAKFKKRLYMILGAVFSVFAVIGLVTVIAGGIGLIKKFTSGEEKKDGFTELIYPAVIMDIEAFKSPDELTSNQMITAAIWSIVMSEERVSKYSVSPGTDTIFIPYMDVEARAVEMFGETHPEFNHCTVGPLESRFVYSDGAYNVKLNPITFTYSPEIRSIVKSGNEYTLTVDYIDELPFWMEKSVAKTVEFSLTENEDGSYTIDSMGIIYVKSSNV